MSQKYKLTKKFQFFEDKEIEIDLPFYGKHEFDCTEVFVKIDEQLNGITIVINSDCITDYGTHQNESYRVDFERPHKFDHGYDFYIENVSSEKEFSRALSLVLDALPERTKYEPNI